MPFRSPDFSGAIQRGREFAQKNTLADMAIAAQQQALDRDQQIRGTMGNLGQVPIKQTLQTLARQGPEGVKVADNLQTLVANMDATELANKQRKAQEISSMLAGVNDQASYDAVRKEAITEEPSMADHLPEKYDPNVVSAIYNHARNIEKVLGGGASSEWSTFQNMTKGLSDQDREKALRIYLGLDPRAMGSSAITTATTPGLTESVSKSESIIKGNVKDSEERSKLKAQLDFQPLIESSVATAKGEAKRAIDKPEAEQRVNIVINNLKEFSNQLKELANHPGLDNITGFLYGRIPTFSQDGRNAQELLNTIKNRTFVATLQAMRDASKTGGAVGNVSDKEGARLENALVSLGQSQDTETFKRRLQRAYDIQQEAIYNIQNAFEKQYKGVAPNISRQTSEDGWSIEEL